MYLQHVSHNDQVNHSLFRDIVHCESLMSTHQGRKSEIDAKSDRFKAVQQTADELIAREHYASIEIKERMENLTKERDVMDDHWDLHWEELQMSKLDF